MIVPRSYAQLRLLLWNRRDGEITEAEALALYEANRQWVDRATMSDDERRFLDGLVASIGQGVFNG